MLHRQYFNSVFVVVKSDAVVANTQAELRSFDSAEPGYVALSGCQKAGQSVENAEGLGLFDGPQFDPGLAAADQLLRHLLLVRAVWL